MLPTKHLEPPCTAQGWCPHPKEDHGGMPHLPQAPALGPPLHLRNTRCLELHPAQAVLPPPQNPPPPALQDEQGNAFSPEKAIALPSPSILRVNFLPRQHEAIPPAALLLPQPWQRTGPGQFCPICRRISLRQQLNLMLKTPQQGDSTLGDQVQD